MICHSFSENHSYSCVYHARQETVGGNDDNDSFVSISVSIVLRVAVILVHMIHPSYQTETERS